MKKKQMINKQHDGFDIDRFETIAKSLFYGENKSKVAVREALNSVFVFDNTNKEKYLAAVSNAMKILKAEKDEFMVVRDNEFNLMLDRAGDTHYVKTLWAVQASYLYDIVSKIYKDPDTIFALCANSMWNHVKYAKPGKEIEKPENAFDGDKFEKALGITISYDYSLFGQFDSVFAQGIEQVAFSEKLNQVESYIFTTIKDIEKEYIATEYGYNRCLDDFASMDYRSMAYCSMLRELMKIKSTSKAVQQARQIWKAKRHLLEKQHG